MKNYKNSHLSVSTILRVRDVNSVPGLVVLLLLSPHFYLMSILEPGGLDNWVAGVEQGEVLSPVSSPWRQQGVEREEGGQTSTGLTSEFFIKTTSIYSTYGSV